MHNTFLELVPNAHLYDSQSSATKLCEILIQPNVQT